MDLPCSRCFLWLHAGGTEPREHLGPLALSRPAIPPSPLSDRVGYSDHVRFRGYIPVHFIPAYNLPVYASQRPLPDATQDSVRGCLLGFTAAVIADGRLQRACKAQRSSNRTCRFPASGFPTGFTARYTESKRTARGFGTVSNSPSPLDTAISGGACHRWCLQAHRQSPRPRHLQKRTRSRGTLLHRHSPVSTLLLPRPTPAVTTA